MVCRYPRVPTFSASGRLVAFLYDESNSLGRVLEVLFVPVGLDNPRVSHQRELGCCTKLQSNLYSTDVAQYLELSSLVMRQHIVWLALAQRPAEDARQWARLVDLALVASFSLLPPSIPLH